MEDSAAKIPTFYSPQRIGASMKEYAVDVIDTKVQHVVSKWFHSEHDADLILWFDSKKNLIKQQSSLMGVVVEWNLMEGLKTGIYSGNEQDEVVKYDGEINWNAVRQCCEVIGFIEKLESKIREDVLANFKSNKRVFDFSATDMAERFGILTPQKSEFSPWNWLTKIWSRFLRKY